MKLSSVKPAGKPFTGKKSTEFLGTGQECKGGLLPSDKRKIARVWRCVVYGTLVDLELM
jgi:hypothetical protein